VLRSKLDYVYQEVVKIRNALEEILNPLKLKNVDEYVPARVASVMSTPVWA
jgi:hypothetical protein